MGLGVLRFLLSCMVLDQHLGFFRDGVLPHYLAFFGIRQFSPIGGGGVAVTGFFVLSGYLIAHVLLGRYASDGRPAVLRFYVSRFLRILPLYWLILLLMALLYGLIGLSGGAVHGFRLFENLTLLGVGLQLFGWGGNPLGGLGISQILLLPQVWTIGLDLLFYLVAPFVLPYPLLRRLLLLTGAVVLALYIPQLPTVPQWFISFYGFGWVYWVAFLVGAEFRLCQWKPLGVWVLSAAVVVVMAAWLPVFLPPVLWQLVTIPAFAVLVAYLGARRNIPPLDRFLGELTYAVYLLQLPILDALAQLHWSHERLWTIAFTFAGAIVLSWAIEKPLDRGRQWLDRKLEKARLPQFSVRPHWALLVGISLLIPLFLYSYVHWPAWVSTTAVPTGLASGQAGRLYRLPVRPALVLQTRGTVIFPDWRFRVELCPPQVTSSSERVCVPGPVNRISLFSLPDATVIGVDSIWVRTFPTTNVISFHNDSEIKLWYQQLTPVHPIWKNVLHH